MKFARRIIDVYKCLSPDSVVSTFLPYFATVKHRTDHSSTMPLDMHEKQVFAIFTERNDFSHSATAVNMPCSRLYTIYQMKCTKIKTLKLSFSRLRKWVLYFAPTDRHRCRHGVVRAPVVRGVADSMKEFVLISPLGKSSGEISRILVQMFHCVCMLGIGVGLFDLNENAPRRFAERVSRSPAQRASEKPTSGFSQVPLQSLPSVIRDMGIPRAVALIYLSFGTACYHLASPVETAGANSGRPPVNACFLSWSLFLIWLCCISLFHHTHMPFKLMSFVKCENTTLILLFSTLHC